MIFPTQRAEPRLEQKLLGRLHSARKGKDFSGIPIYCERMRAPNVDVGKQSTDPLRNRCINHPTDRDEEKPSSSTRTKTRDAAHHSARKHKSTTVKSILLKEFLFRSDSYLTKHTFHLLAERVRIQRELFFVAAAPAHLATSTAVRAGIRSG